MGKRTSKVYRGMEYSAVYVVGPTEGRPVKIGMTADPEHRFTNLQHGAWVELRRFYTAWFVGKPLSMRVEAEAHRILDDAERRIRGEWFDVTAEFGEKTILVAARNLGLDVLDEEEYERRAKKAMERDAVRYASTFRRT